MTSTNPPASLDALTPADYNPRTISDEALAGLGKSQDTFGPIAQLTINERDDGSHVIVAGHQRRADHLDRYGPLPIEWLDGEWGFYRTPDGVRHPVRRVRVDLDTERAMNLAANSRHIAGEFDEAAAEAMLRELEESMGEAFDDLRFDELLAEVTPVEFIARDAPPPQLASGDREPFQTMTFTVHDTQADTIRAALKRAKADGAFSGPNENSNGNALARIAEAYHGKG